MDRPAIVHINETYEDGQARVVITLGWQDAEYAGEAVGSAKWSARPRLVGEATLRAIELVTGDRVDLSLAAVATTELGAGRIAVAQVTIAGLPEPLVGSALLPENDESGATVRAVLDALNRRLSKLL